MRAENDFALIEPLFFSTSNVGGKAPDGSPNPRNATALKDAYDVDALKRCDIIITCQGGEYTKDVYPRLRAAGWNGYWIDAAKTLRMNDDAVIVLDPVNLPVIKAALAKGVRNYIGGNCTVSCMLMGVGALFKADLVEWMSCATYQAASGGGAQHMRELLTQYGTLHAEVRDLLDDPASAILEIDRKVRGATALDVARRDSKLRRPAGRQPDPVDRRRPRRRHEPRGMEGRAETNKILGRGAGFGAAAVPVDSICVRIGAMRCHSQALTLKLKKDVPLADIESMIAGDNEWVKVVPNTREASAQQLTPVAVTGTMSIPVGRLRKLAMGPQYLGAFTVGDQLLWGAAEPLRRMLRFCSRLERGRHRLTTGRHA